jgi:hypothetical protein
MDVVTKIRGYIAKWDSTGEADWCARLIPSALFCPIDRPVNSRKFLMPLAAVDPQSADALAAAWQTLLNAALSTWSGPVPLSVPALAAFARSTLHALPSSSHDTSPSPSGAHALSELLVDAVWALDTQTEDYLADAKAAVTAAEAAAEVKEAQVAAAQTARAQFEKDKETLAELVRRLSVRPSIWDITIPSLCAHMQTRLCLRGWALKPASSCSSSATPSIHLCSSLILAYALLTEVRSPGPRHGPRAPRHRTRVCGRTHRRQARIRPPRNSHAHRALVCRTTVSSRNRS